MITVLICYCFFVRLKLLINGWDTKQFQIQSKNNKIMQVNIIINMYKLKYIFFFIIRVDKSVGFMNTL